MTAFNRGAETMAYKTIALPSGLTVLVRPMPGYSAVHAIYATKFGAIDRDFTVNGKTVHLPAGVAHFLEHKMFESEDGDAFSKYAKTGANANAYTGFDRTAYIFTASSRIDESLDVLLGMVGTPYFTEQTIQKEQGIIGQEIKMYDDSVDWRLMMALFQSLYENHPLRDDIAGSVQSIAQITPEMLYDCCAAFYRPENMVLALAGNITEEQVLAACARAGLDTPREPVELRRLYPEEGPMPWRKEYEITMPIVQTGFGLAFKEPPLEKGNLKREIIYDLLPDLICGGMTPLYRRLYDEGLVNPEFDGETLLVEGAACVLFTGESQQCDRVLELLREEIARIKTQGVEPELFTLVKNQLYGEAIVDMESVVDAASSMASAHQHGRTLQEGIQTLAALTKEDVDRELATMLDPETSVVVRVLPQKS